MKKNNLSLVTLFFAFALALMSCKKDPCKDVVCQNGGTPVATGKTCSCDCPSGYEGQFCETKSNFVKCKINGADYQSSASGIIPYTVTLNSVLYRQITTSNASQSNIITLTFKNALAPGTYQAGYMEGSDFFGRCTLNQAYDYYSSSGSITLTNVSDKYEGTFSFIAGDNPPSSADSVTVTEGSFSIRK